MTVSNLSYYIAKGLVDTGIEGGFGSVSCSTAGDYPSIGCSQWEGERANKLLYLIEGGGYFANRSYSDLIMANDLKKLSKLLESSKNIQLSVLSSDCISYVEDILNLDILVNNECIVYAGMWCPTSSFVVCSFLKKHRNEVDWNDILVMHNMFLSYYAGYADCLSYAKGYGNRARSTYDYVQSIMKELV